MFIASRRDERGHAMKHEDMRWNQETLEWFCAKCGRTSGRIKKEDALAQLEEYKCELPTGESRRTPVIHNAEPR